MKTFNTANTLMIAAAVATTSASAQSLESASAFDILVLDGGKVELVDANQLWGNVGYSSSSSATKNKDIQDFEGTVYVHSTADFRYESATFQPSGGIVESADAILDQANTDALAYMTYLDGLSSNQSYTAKQKLEFNLSTEISLTVIDFKEVDMTDGQDFNLTGRAGFGDKVIFRISDDFAFEKGSVNLTNLDPEDVIWYSPGNKDVDLHRGGGSFTGTVIAPDGRVRIGATNFTGSVIGSELKLGSSFDFTGSSIPEPSSSLLLVLSGVSGLLLYRRRK